VLNLTLYLIMLSTRVISGHNNTGLASGTHMVWNFPHMPVWRNSKAISTPRIVPKLNKSLEDITEHLKSSDAKASNCHLKFSSNDHFYQACIFKFSDFT